jgi:hypothetical protein
MNKVKFFLMFFGFISLIFILGNVNDFLTSLVLMIGVILIFSVSCMLYNKSSR